MALAFAEPVAAAAAADPPSHDPAVQPRRAALAAHFPAPAPVVPPLDGKPKDAQQLAVVVVGKGHLHGEPARQARVVREEALHLPGVAGQHENDFSREVLDLGEQMVEHGTAAGAIAEVNW